MYKNSNPYRIKKIIFLVSSDIELRLELSKEFSQYGYQIYEFESIQQVIPFLKIQTPNILILHYNNHQENINLLIAEIKEELKEKCFFIFLINQSLQKKDFSTRLDIIRIGGNQIFYIQEDSKTIPLNNILNEIDRFLELNIYEPIHILYIKNKDDFNNIYIDFLKQANFKVEVFSYEQIPQLLNPKELMILQELYYAIILNLYYPDFLGIELAAIIRQFPELKYIPILFISKDQDINKYLYSIQRGGDDYLIHPVQPEIFITTIYSQYYKYKLFKNTLEKDLMTNLYNHHSFLRKLEMKINLLKKANQNFAYALVDIDKFKEVNDQYGHQAGDQVIINLARFLKHNLRDYDIIGRYGGEEFGIILNVQSKEDAFKIMDRVRKNFSYVNHRFNSYVFNCTISIGIAMFPEFYTATELISAADYGLYQSKEQGRNKVIIIEKKHLKKDSQ
jgi:diguanylate cyclase (GGDEF)-like protein